MAVELERFGDCALRARLPEGAHTASVLSALRRVPGVFDVVVGERHAVVTFDPRRRPEGLEAALEASLSRDAPPCARRVHVIRVRYDGADLDEVARRAGLSRSTVADLHAKGTYEVVAVGFLPGFAYARGLDPRLVGPRRSSPRARVSALSVAIAGPYTGVYPFASPGGWNVIGTAVGFSPFDAHAGAMLALGDGIRFVMVGP